MEFTMSKRFYLAIKDRNGESQHYEVPEEVYIYVNQLELGLKEIQQTLIKLQNVSRVL